MPYAIQIATHAVAAWHDYRTREIPDKTWLLAVPAVALTLYMILTSTETTKALYLSSLIAGLTLAGLCYMFRIVGGADIKSIITIALGCPPLITRQASGLLTVLDLPTIAVITNALLGVLAYTIYIAVKNLRTFRICEQKYHIRGTRKAMLYLTTMCVPAREVLEKPHKYAVVKDPHAVTNILYRIVLEDPREQLRNTRPEEHILVVYYMPYIVCILLGLVLYASTRHSILTLILESMTTLITRT